MFGCDDVEVRILLIEDDRRLAELLVRRLRAEGHAAETCDDGIEGLAATVPDPQMTIPIRKCDAPELDRIYASHELRLEDGTAW